MLLRAETRVDRSTSALAVERSPRDGVVHLRVPLTWIGVRTYRDAATGKLTRELRRPEQVWSASHVETLKRLTCTHGHPSEAWEGQTLPVMLDARADATSGPGEDGTLRRPPGVLQVGQVGDLIERVEIEGVDLPVAGVAIHGSAAIADIEAGKTQTSLGYGCLVDHTPGEWTDSGGRVWAYDAEHVLDIEDPRVVAAAAEGFDPSTLGANHLAVAIARGRGGPMSELLPRLDALSWEVVGDGVVYNPNTGPCDPCAPVHTPDADPRLLAAMESAGVTSTVKGQVPAAVLIAGLSGSYSWGSKWRGWIDFAAGIAFVDVNSKGLWWPTRSESGAVVGEPVAFAWVGPVTRFDADPPAPRDDLGEPRLFTMIRNGDESGVSGTGRVMDGVLWPDGTVATRWRTVTASDGGFDSWTTFHRIHVCAHPDNATELPFADGAAAPECVACRARAAVSTVRGDEVAEAAPYPPGVATILLPARSKGLADKVSALPGAKSTVKADGIEINLPPDLAGPIADLFASMAEQIRGMSSDLTASDAAVGEAAAENATLKEQAAKMACDAELVAPLIAEARKTKRLGLILEATKVAGGKLDVADSDDDFAVKRAAVKARLGDSFKRDSVDAIEAAYVALSTAGGRDPAHVKVVPDPVKPSVETPVLRQDAASTHTPSALYDDG